MSMEHSVVLKFWKV